MYKTTILCILFLVFAGLLLMAEDSSGKQQNNILQDQLKQSESKMNDTSSQEPEQKLFVHGYLSQAYARISNNILYGIPKEGTADYRNAALQFRYAMTKNDNFIIQLAHQRIGDSPVMKFKSDVELDWVFFEHHFNDVTFVKVGKIPVPQGIYNETRDVGVVLPFYLPPSSFYAEGSYTNETINGILASRTLHFGKDWSLDIDGYYGGWTYVVRTTGVSEAKVKDAAGFQTWINTPIEKLRFGVGAIRYKSPAISFVAVPEETTWKQWYVSIDAAINRFVFQSEYRSDTLKGADYKSYYGLFGVHLVSKLMVNFDAEFIKFKVNVPLFGDLSRDLSEEYTIGINYKFRPDVVAKLEMHWNKGFVYDDLDPMAFLMNIPTKSHFVILSLSASF